MPTLRRTSFINRFADKSISLEKINRDRNLSTELKADFSNADINRDGVISGNQELDKLFGRMDRHDRNGNPSTVTINSGQKTTKLYQAAIQAAIDGGPSNNTNNTNNTNSTNSTDSVNSTTNVRGSNAGERALSIARRELALGVRENARSNEDTRGHIRKYRNAVTAPGYARNRPPEAWCSDFISYTFKESGNPIGKNGQGIAYVPSLKSWLQSSGKYHAKGTTTPRPGDIVIFKFGSRPDHTGIVESYNPRTGQLVTIEGNTTGPGGQGLHRKTRSMGSVQGFGRI